MKAIRIPGGLSFRAEPRALAVVCGLAVLALAAGVVLIGTGDFTIAPADVVRSLLGSGTPAQDFIINELRLPRVLVALLVGASLGISGALFQSISRNPLGSPDVIGFGQGSSVGALTVIVFLPRELGRGPRSARWSAASRPVSPSTSWPGRRGVHGYRLVLVGIGASRDAHRRHPLPAHQVHPGGRPPARWSGSPGSLDGRDWAQVWPLSSIS